MGETWLFAPKTFGESTAQYFVVGGGEKRYGGVLRRENTEKLSCRYGRVGGCSG